MNRLKAVLSPASGYEDVLQYSLDTMGSWYTLKIASNLFFLLWIEYLKVILDSSHHIRMVLLRSWICVSAMCLLSMVAVRLSRSRIGKILFDRAAPRQVWLVCGYFIILAAAWSATHVGFEWNADTKDSLLQYGLEIPLDVGKKKLYSFGVLTVLCRCLSYYSGIHSTSLCLGRVFSLSCISLFSLSD